MGLFNERPKQKAHLEVVFDPPSGLITEEFLSQGLEKPTKPLKILFQVGCKLQLGRQKAHLMAFLKAVSMLSLSRDLHEPQIHI